MEVTESRSKTVDFKGDVKLAYISLENRTLKCDDRNHESSRALHTLLQLIQPVKVMLTKGHPTVFQYLSMQSLYDA